MEVATCKWKRKAPSNPYQYNNHNNRKSNSEPRNQNSTSFQDDSLVQMSDSDSDTDSSEVEETMEDSMEAVQTSSQMDLEQLELEQQLEQYEEQQQQQHQQHQQHQQQDFRMPEEPRTLRKNLGSTFDEMEVEEHHHQEHQESTCETAPVLLPPLPPSVATAVAAAGTVNEREKQLQSVSAKIAHYEQQAASSSHGPSATASTTMTTTAATTTQLPSKGKSLSVYLRLRPLVETAAVSASGSTIQVLPSGSLLHPCTKIRTIPPANTTNSNNSNNNTSANTNNNLVKEYEFTRVFDDHTSQPNFYRDTTAPLVRGLFGGNPNPNGNGDINNSNNSTLSGESALLLAYGITNAGKTHTVLGPSTALQKSEGANKLPTEWGLIPRALADLLQRVEQVNTSNRKRNNNSNKTMTLHLSYFEIYKDQVFDLLPRSSSNDTKQSFVKQAPLKVGEYQGQVMVRGLSRHTVDDLPAGLALVARAKHMRHTATNRLNPHSSRSHCICQFTVVTTTNSSSNFATSTAAAATAKPDSESNSISDEKHLWMVDLAGSERSKRTGVGALRQKEASWINQSLMTLMRCLQVLRENQENNNNNNSGSNSSNDAVVPYRDCKLTHLLSSHWTGAGGSGSGLAGRTTMIVNVHPGTEDYNETQHVLQYAASAKTIRTVTAAAAGATGGGFTIGTSSAGVAQYGYNGRKKETAGAKRTRIAAAAKLKSAATSTVSTSVQQRVAKLVRKLSPKKLRSRMVDRKRKSVVEESLQAQSEQHQDHIVSASATMTTAVAAKTERSAGQWMPAAKRRRAGEKVDAAPADSASNAGNSNTKLASVAPASLRGPDSFATNDDKEWKSLKMSFSIAQAESQVLRQEKRELEDQLEETETAVRMEVAEEMDEQMKAMREQYQDIIDRLKSKMHAPPEQTKSVKKVQMDRAAEKLDDLIGKVEECEEEMARMREEHQQEVDEVVHKYETMLKAKDEELKAMPQRVDQLVARALQLEAELERANDNKKSASANASASAGPECVAVNNDDVRRLERELDASRAQVTKLERSKKELIDNYEKLLREEDDDNDDDSGSDNEEESSDGEENASPTPKKDTRRLTRRQIQHSEVALPPSKAKRATRSSNRRPLGSVSSNIKRSDSSLSDNSFGPSQWLFPKKKNKKDPETGTFLRPRGRAPIGVDVWDDSKGAWRLTVT